MSDQRVDVTAVMGVVGMPAPISEMASRRWDAIVVGGGHNGLTVAAYLARSGRSVLVLERSERLGGACTLERPFEDEPDYIVSPCACVVGLLDEVVIRELELERHGYRVTPADPNLWCPLTDGSSLAAFLDPARTAAHMREQGFSDRDIRGREAYEATFKRLRLALRKGAAGDTWQAPSPSRAEIELGLASRGDRRRDPRRHRRPRPRYPRVHRASAGARPARHRGAGRAHGRPHLPG